MEGKERTFKKLKRADDITTADKKKENKETFYK